MHLLSLFNFKHLLLLALLFLAHGATFISSTHASTLYEEQNLEQLHTKLSKLDLNKERQEVLPPEMLIAIYDAYPSMLPKVARINHKWHDWAQPRLSAYAKLFKDIGMLSIENTRWSNEKYTNAFINLVFQRSSFDGATQLKYYNRIRERISDTINSVKLESTTIFIDNPDLLHTLLSTNHGSCFDLSKLLRGWSELQVHLSAVLLCNDLWSGTKILESSLITPEGPPAWYSQLHQESGELRPLYRYSSIRIISLIDEAQKHQVEFPSFQHEVYSPLAQFIELDKMALKASHKDKDFYSAYPTYEVMKAFQAVPVDLDHNTRKDRLLKLEQLKASILTFAKKHVGPMEFYISFIKHQLDRG